MLPLKILRLRSKGLLPRRLIAAVEPDSKEWHVSQTGHTVQREAKAGWLAQVTTRFLGMLSWKARGAPGSPIASSDVTETIESVAAPNSRKHATEHVELCVIRRLAVRRRRKLDNPVSEPKLLDPRDISD